MARYETFTYKDNLGKRVFERLPEKLKILGNNDPEVLLILRLLSGNVSLTHKHSNKTIKSKVNYLASDLTPLSDWGKSFPKLFSEDITPEDIETFIVSTKYNNRAFYSVILA